MNAVAVHHILAIIRPLTSPSLSLHTLPSSLESNVCPSWLDRPWGHGLWYGVGESVYHLVAGHLVNAQSLLSQGYPVKAYDVYAPSLDKAVSAGAVRCETPAAAATDVQVLGLMVVNAVQVEDILFGVGRVAEGL